MDEYRGLLSKGRGEKGRIRETRDHDEEAEREERID